MLLIALSLQVLVPKLMPSASAGSSFLCVGFSDCGEKGHSNSGYHAHWGHMYWRMYSGRNCVNYAAYRMVARGLPDVRPWSGSGNAGNWGHAMSSITDKTPVVGSIAWWNYGASGASSLGHVAYVEKVVNSSEIIVSESNYGSDFDWRVITRSGSWPTGFIHFKDSKIVNEVRPTLAGTPHVGRRYTFVPGKWNPVSNASIQWFANGKVLPKQTRRYIKPTEGLLGKRLTVRVTASLPHYQSTSVTTGASAPVAPGNLTIVTSPTITGTPTVGQQLTVGGALFKPAVGPTAIRWYADGVLIPGATTRVLTLGAAQVGKRITATVVGGRRGWNSLASPTRVAVGPVVWPQLTPTTSGTVTGKAGYGRLLKASPGRFKARGVTVSYQWYRGVRPIKGATRRTYRTTAADLGRVIRVHVVAHAPRFRDYVRNYGLGAAIQASPAMRIHVTGLKRAERIRIRIVGPGGYLPTGTLSVMTHAVVKQVAMHKGLAVVRFNHIPAGTRKVRVTFPGNTILRARVKEVTARVYKH